MHRIGVCVVIAACTKTSSEPRRMPEVAAAPAVVERTLPRAPVKTTPRELFTDFTRPDADGVALIDKYRHGATFTATIKTVGIEEDGTPVVWIDVDGENLITLDFEAPAPDGLRAGAELTVTCKIAGASGALMMVTDCVRGV